MFICHRSRMTSHSVIVLHVLVCVYHSYIFDVIIQIIIIWCSKADIKNGGFLNQRMLWNEYHCRMLCFLFLMTKSFIHLYTLEWPWIFLNVKNNMQKIWYQYWDNIILCKDKSHRQCLALVTHLNHSYISISSKIFMLTHKHTLEL